MLRSLCVLAVWATVSACGDQGSRARSDSDAHVRVDSALLVHLAADSAHAEWASDALRFYRNRGFKTIWYIRDSLLPTADSLLARVEWCVNEGLDTMGWNVGALHRLAHGADSIAATDVRLTQVFFQFARFEAFGRVAMGMREHWEHPTRELNLATHLDSIIERAGSLDIISPRWGGFLAMRRELQRLHELPDWPTDLIVNGKIEPGARSALIPRIRQRLALAQPPDSLLYDSLTAMAVRNYQSRFGQLPDGVIGSGTIAAMNVPRAERMHQLVVNMERLKWLPDDLGVSRVVANLPEFVVSYINPDTTLSMRAVVGKPRDKTPVFHDTLEYLVLRPYWNVPLSITRDEIIPALREDPTYLERHNMQVLSSGEVFTDSIDWHTARASDFKIRQRPGTYNSLGTVKFIFPNKHQVYFHDTNAKSYFETWPRAHSHGCMRIDKPQEFAELLLRDQKQWTPDSIASARSRGGQKQVLLSKKIPVWILYLTCTVDSKGVVHYWDDVYGYDQGLWQRIADPLTAQFTLTSL